jgi:hypothetical protein
VSDAKEAATEEKPKRTKGPARFHVFRAHNSEVDGMVWVPLTSSPVTASTRKEAIRETTAEMEDKAGTFWAVPADQFQPVTRKTRQETIDEFV